MIWRIPPTGRVETLVDAPPSEVYELITDVARVAQWSHECTGAQWLDGASAAAVGARFRGTNRSGRFGWSRVCTVTELVPDRRFAYRTSGGVPHDSTAWSFDLEPEGDGTRVIQRYEILEFARWMELVIYALVPAHRDRTPRLREDLARLGTIVRSR